MKVVLDRTKCTALGICESFAPEVFEVADDGELVVLRSDVTDITDGELDAVRQAVDGCPTAALRLES